MTNHKCTFEIVKTLGVGGMATVYLARRDEGGRTRDVAVKKLHAFLAADSASVAVLEDEAQLGACIRHPNVVQVIDFVAGATEHEGPALVMEWIEGVDLAELVRATTKSGRRLPLDVVAAIACDVLAGLHAAHESRRDDGLALEIVHRDVSPQNILVGFDGVVRVTDFGVAKAAWRQQHTEHGAIKGKLGYLAPEQLTGLADRRADVFGVGVVLWELLTGARLRVGDGVEVLVEILCQQMEAPSKRNADAAALDAIVLRALERSAEDRFASAADMLAAIESVVVRASAERVAEVTRSFVSEPAQPSIARDAITIDEHIERPRIERHVRRDRNPSRRTSHAPPPAWAIPDAEDDVLDLLIEMRSVCAGRSFAVAACPSRTAIVSEAPATSSRHSLALPTPSRDHRPPPFRRA
jgi:eukaryotic-like serine/threonine-protein kinase